MSHAALEGANQPEEVENATMFARVRDTLLAAFAIPWVVVIIFTMIVVYGTYILPDGFDGSGGLSRSLATLVFINACGFVFRVRHPGSRLAGTIEGISLFLLMAMLASLASSVLAIGSGELIDEYLDAADKVLFPFFDWPAVTRAIAERPQLHGWLTDIYTSLNWQPALLIVCIVVVSGLKVLNTFLATWGIGLATCILPFHWLPALSAYGFYGVGRGEMPDRAVELGWSFLPVMMGMREGTTTALSFENLTGMVTIPSFHACAAVMLMWFWWKVPYLRWPMLALNLAMVVATVPIGSHYIIDVVVGILVAAGAIHFAISLERLKLQRKPAVASR